MQRLSSILRFVAFGFALFIASGLSGQTLATVQGQVSDPSGAVVPGATVTVTNTATSVSQTTKTDSSGTYRVPALPIGTYDVDVQASGLERQRAKSLVLEVGRTTVQNFQLKVAQANEVVTVESEIPVVESTTMTVGTVMDPKNVQQIPLNGRHFVDLGFLVPGSVTPPANGFLAQPIRGQGSLAFNTAGQREDAVNFLVNGVNLADMTNGQITFQPSIATLDEFKVDNSTYSAESGRNSGAVVNMATRSGTNSFHGEAFDFMRNNYFDARNFFNKVGAPQSQFIRNDFGGAVGGPIIKNKLFFYGSYEGLRQRQGITINQTVLSATERTAALASPSTAVRQVVPLIPQANDGGSKFLGSASAPVKLDQWTGDISYNLSDKDRVHGYYALQKDVRTEPTDAGGGSTVPGYGDQRTAQRQLFTFSESHVFGPRVVNEARLGFNRIHIIFDPINKDDATKFGINSGRSGPASLPELNIQSTGLDFGGVSNFPQGRGDLTTVLGDTLTYLRNNHTFKFGWEGRQVNDNGTFIHDPGFVQFASNADFIAGKVSLFTNGGDVTPHFVQRALDLFAMDSFKLASYLTLELGLRYEWNMTPFEKDNRWSEFLPATGTLVQVGTSALPLLYQQNNKNFEPRLGFAWDVFHNGKTVLRSGYGWAVDQTLPITNPAQNPPFVNASRFATNNVKFSSLGTLSADAAAAGASVNTVDQNLKNGYVQSYNLNIQQEITPSTAIMVGYFGSKGTHLRQNINLNQPFYTNANANPPTQSRPFPTIAASSPISPNVALGTSLTDRVGNGNSNYNALWVTGTRRLAAGLQFSANYTWSKSLDYASQTGAVQPENSLNVRGDYGPSDFDARHRFVISSLYELPFKGNRFVDGWRVSGVLSLQSGSPMTLINGVSSTALTGVSTNRPDVIGPVTVVNQIITDPTSKNVGLIQWLAPNSVCDPRVGACAAGTSYAIPVALNAAGGSVFHFGNMRRNSVPGPDFKNLDMSLAKTTRITERLRLELRAEAFDLANHPNFGFVTPTRTAVPGNGNVTGNLFGVINSTRFPNGDSGSARQLQFAAKMIF